MLTYGRPSFFNVTGEHHTADGIERCSLAELVPGGVDTFYWQFLRGAADITTIASDHRFNRLQRCFHSQTHTHFQIVGQLRPLRFLCATREGLLQSRFPAFGDLARTPRGPRRRDGYCEGHGLKSMAEFVGRNFPASESVGTTWSLENLVGGRIVRTLEKAMALTGRNVD